MRNPYIVGRRITEPELFFGRESLFKFIENNLKQGQKVILLNGQRRIGKSSVLFHIPSFVAPDEFVFVEFDLQDKSKWSSNQILYHLTKTIIDKLQLASELLTIREEEMRVYKFVNILSNIENQIGDKKIVLLLDEFDVLDDYQTNSHYFFADLKSILSGLKLSTILVIGRNLDDLPKLLDVFKNPPHAPIGLLDKESAKNLITQPTKDFLEYSEDAIQEILKLSSGHPYFTQVICHDLFDKAREKEQTQVNCDDVINVIDSVLESAKGALDYFRNGLPIPEKVIFSAVAETYNSTLKSPTQLLESYGVTIIPELTKALDILIKEGFVKQNELGNYQIQVELVRIWLNKSYSLRQTIKELDILNNPQHPNYTNINNDYKYARHLSEHIQDTERIQNAIQRYLNILQDYPNCFTVLFDLAKLYLEIQQYKNAFKLYSRLYLVNPVQYQAEFIQCSLEYAKLLDKPKARLQKYVIKYRGRES